MYFLDSYISQVGDLLLTIEHMFYSLPYLYSSISSEDIYLSSIRELVNEDISKQRGGGFPGGAVVESLPANAGDTGSIPGLGRSHMLRSN